MIPTYSIGQERAQQIAILGLEVVGAVDAKSVRVARELTTALRSIAGSGPYAIAPNSDKELIDLKLMHNCEDERTECMANISRKLGADYLLYGRIERTSRAAGSRGYQTALRLLDVTSGRLASWNDFIPTTEASGAQLAAWARRGYERLIASGQPRRDEGPSDRALISATNETFWKITRYKPGQRLDMTDRRDRAMSKTWLDIYAQVKGHRDRATSLAQRTLNETVTPYILVVEQRDGSLRPQVFQGRGNLDVQYTWLLDQPQLYTYLAAFDFTQKRDAPLYDQFALTRRSQVAAWVG